MAQRSIAHRDCGQVLTNYHGVLKIRTFAKLIQHSTRETTMRKITTLFALAISWLAWSGHYNGLILSFGALSCLFVFYLLNRIGLADLDPRSARTFSKMVFYIPWLLVEVIKSNIAVARIVWRPTLDINPAVEDIPATQATSLGLVAFANSVTLTPGTLSMNAEAGSLKVHALDASSFEGDGFAEMDRRVTELEQ